MGVESQVTAAAVNATQLRKEGEPRRRLEMNDWNGEEDERSERLMAAGT